MPGGISLERLREAGLFSLMDGLSSEEIDGLTGTTEMVVSVEGRSAKIAVRPIVVIEKPKTIEEFKVVIFKPVGSVSPLAQAMLGLVG